MFSIRGRISFPRGESMASCEGVSGVSMSTKELYSILHMVGVKSRGSSSQCIPAHWHHAPAHQHHTHLSHSEPQDEHQHSGIVMHWHIGISIPASVGRYVGTCAISISSGLTSGRPAIFCGILQKQDVNEHRSRTITTSLIVLAQTQHH